MGQKAFLFPYGFLASWRDRYLRPEESSREHPKGGKCAPENREENTVPAERREAEHPSGAL